jgi:hypothetical protein
VEKRQRYHTETPLFSLRDRHKLLCKSAALQDVISYFNRLPRLITG